MKKSKTIVANESGQGVLEYLILSALIGISCLVAISQFGDVIQKRVHSMKEHVSKRVKSSW